VQGGETNHDRAGSPEPDTPFCQSRSLPSPQGPRMLQLNWTGRHCYRRPVSIQAASSFAPLFRADLGLDFNSAAALLDKSLHLAETETRTLPNGLRREIGVERPWCACRSPHPKSRYNHAREMTLQRRRRKSPLVMELINDRYCRSLRSVTP
jgi:hypothetical protein